MLASPLPLSLFGSGRAELHHDPVYVRHHLDPCCWVDTVHGFIKGADSLFATVEAEFPWYRGRRLMYGTWYDEPRMSAEVEPDQPEVPAVVPQAIDALGEHYDRSFSGLFCNYYRTGDDSVAWHADRIGRQVVDPLVAIISLGGPRTFAMRDRAGHSPARRWVMHGGDLLVMGGATQHHWEHAIAKTAVAAPRISLTTRAGWDECQRARATAGGRPGSS